MPKISVIIPIYNVEQYLPQCLDSIINQTYKDIEIICINDGSTDNSCKILKQYTQKDCRIKIIKQKNQGASVARNKGLDMATGEYICFIDSDDYVHPQMLNIIIKHAEHHNVDFVQYRHKEIRKNDEKFSFINEDNICGKIINNPMMVSFKKQQFSNTFGPVAKLFKRTLIGNTRFIPHLQFEDYPFIYEILSKRPKSLYLDAFLYFYRILPVSLCHTKSDPQQIKDYHTGINHIFNIYKDSTFSLERNFLIKDFIPIILKHQLGRCNRASPSIKKQMFDEFSKELIDLNNKGLIKWRGHKFIRYLLYKKLIKTQKNKNF
ncbi:MAG: glycosyltransferase [Alphaproteobacteria bacterium]|nr:glycosyltransferase [Alphaproteobacteria bacterium]